jgi:hypothetical protein
MGSGSETRPSICADQPPGRRKLARGITLLFWRRGSGGAVRCLAQVIDHLIAASAAEEPFAETVATEALCLAPGQQAFAQPRNGSTIKMRRELRPLRRRQMTNCAIHHRPHPRQHAGAVSRI